MNSYSIPMDALQGVQEDLYDIAQSILFSQSYSVSDGVGDAWYLNSQCPFSFGVNTKAKRLLNFSNNNNTLEGIDKSTVEVGDVVLYLHPDIASVTLAKTWYDDFIVMLIGSVTQFYVTIGVSNSSQSDFNDPFPTKDKRLVLSAQKIVNLRNELGIDDEIIETVSAISQGIAQEVVKDLIAPSGSTRPAIRPAVTPALTTSISRSRILPKFRR